MTTSGRPGLPQLRRGDRLIMRDGKRTTEVRAVAVGRKFVHVIAADRFDAYDPGVHRWLLRKFLLADQSEGVPGTRVGRSASIATPEQHEYDRLHGDAHRYLLAQGIVLGGASRWCGHEVLLARLMRANEPPPYRVAP